MNLDRSTSHSARPARVLLLLALGVCFLIAAGGRPATPAQAAFPGQNGKIAFTSYRDGNAEIYVMEPDGSNETRLTFNEASDAEPAWSPDGTRIAFESDRDGDSEIFVMNADGSEQTQLTFNSLGDAGATWSPDGNRIAFHSGGGGVNFDVYVMDYDGSNILPLTSDPALDGFPNWSPDGSKVAFHSNRDGNFEIYVMNADGSNETNLTQHPGYDVDPSWSPDGTQIAFESVRPPAANSEIYVMWADGSSPVNISGHSGNDLDPAWSPSGFEIVFETDRDGNRDIYVMWPDGDNPMSLTGDPAHDQHPDWQTIPSDGGKISIIQQVKPAGTTGPAPWEFDGDLGVFSIEAEGGGVVVENLSSGEYTISQAKVDGFGQAVNCDSGEFGALEVTLQLDIQESVTCTFRATKVMTGAGPTVFSSNRDGDPDIYLLDPSAKTDELIDLMRACLAAKKAGHGIDEPTFVPPPRPMSAIGG